MASHPPLVPRGGKVGIDGGAVRVSRNRRSDFAIWWREIDRVLLGLILALMAIGTVAVAAGSPASARRLSTASVRLDDLHFFYMHIRYQFIGLVAM
ncbi:MAG TPA: cell division protein FtsW, partial [Candidatus Omnitrophota bacterium]|nr:cell division protein FtsW [Candidatus Omnitrophota bacterium]